MSVKQCRSQFNVDLESLDAVRQHQTFQRMAEIDDISIFDSKTESIDLPDRVLRLVAFRFSHLQYSSSTGIVVLFQIKSVGDESVFLVSVDTSFKSKPLKKGAGSVRIKYIEELGCSLMKALTLSNNMLNASIQVLHIPVFPKGLSIRSRICGVALARALVAGMAMEHNPISSPNIMMQTQL